MSDDTETATTILRILVPGFLALALLEIEVPVLVVSLLVALATTGVRNLTLAKQEHDPTATALNDLWKKLEEAAGKVLNPPQVWELGRISDHVADDLKTWSRDCGCPCTQSSGSAGSSPFSIAATFSQSSRLAIRPTNVRIENFTGSRAVVSSRARLDGRSDVTVRIGGIRSVGQGSGNVR
jgi:hypothetical protein